MGVRDGRRIKASHNPVLESFFHNQSQNPKEDQLSHLATRCNLSLRQVQRWFRHRRNQERPLLSMKFSEACIWSFLGKYYGAEPPLAEAGLDEGSFQGLDPCFLQEPWFWKPELCWEGFPKQVLKPAIYWWYLLEFAIYLSLLITLSFDVKRKDFKQQVIHHFSAIILIFFSYCSNYIRIGTLVMLIHDVSDIFLEAGKMASYAQWKNSSEIIFVIFTVVFLVSRLILFPCKVLHSTYYSSMDNHKPFFGYYFSNTLLMILQALNVFWSLLILHMFYRFVIVGKMPDDVRSDLEEQCTDDEQSEIGQQKMSGGLSPTKRRRLVPKT
ncbi:ceramide synthase 4-like isoform X1 [Petaurus breviceps papuanus]|uniref:ceramide synthase 4-like isoform X1 n=1 Tax=Petaurus breviceps papuanus TaxID=3040969 RepID=UPI0036DDF976